MPDTMLPQQTIDRIEKEADIFAEKKQAEITEPYNTYVDLSDGYETGAKAEATRALPLNEALRRAIGIIESECDDIELLTDLKEVIVKYSIASYESGEPVEPVEPAPIWYDKKMMKQDLLNNNYSEEIANELSERWAQDCQRAFKKGWEKAFNDKRHSDEPYIYANEEPVQGNEAKEVIPPRVAFQVLAARDALATRKYEDAYHELYKIASPDFNKYEPWEELEQLAKQWQQK